MEVSLLLGYQSTHWRHCFVSLSKILYPLLSSGSTQEDKEIIPAWLKNCWLGHKASAQTSKISCISILSLWKKKFWRTWVHTPFIHQKKIIWFENLICRCCLLHILFTQEDDFQVAVKQFQPWSDCSIGLAFKHLTKNCIWKCCLL